MARYAMIDDASSIVVNVIEWDGNTATWQPPVGHTMIEDVNSEIGVGFKQDGAAFRSPPGGMPGTDSQDEIAAAKAAASAATAKPAPKKK